MLPKYDRLAFLVSSLGSNQLAYHILSRDWGSREVIAFAQNIVKPIINPPFATLNITEVYGYTGAAIATSLDTAEILLGCHGPSRKIFYVWDLEWIYKTGRSFEEMSRIFRNLELVARSPSHKTVIQQSWNVEVKSVVENCQF